jgi:UDP-N-acetyl-D-mannosaminuronate dehydrogenase
MLLAEPRPPEGRQRVIGFDINRARIDELKSGHDRTNETDASALKASRLHMTCDPADLREASFYVVTVPTPIDSNRQPDLTPMVRASETVGKALKAGAVVVFDAIIAAPSWSGSRGSSAAWTSSWATPPSASTRATAPTRWRR